MKAKYIKGYLITDLTDWKMYDVIDSNEGYIKIKDDIWEERFFNKNYFEIIEEQKEIYYVLVKWRWEPTKQHNSLEEAEKEAQRLVRAERRETLILKALKKYEIEIKEINL